MKLVVQISRQPADHRPAGQSEQSPINTGDDERTPAEETHDGFAYPNLVLRRYPRGSFSLRTRGVAQQEHEKQGVADADDAEQVEAVIPGIFPASQPPTPLRAE